MPTPEQMAELFARLARIERKLNLDGIPVTKVDPFARPEVTTPGPDGSEAPKPVAGTPTGGSEPGVLFHASQVPPPLPGQAAGPGPRVLDDLRSTLDDLRSTKGWPPAGRMTPPTASVGPQKRPVGGGSTSNTPKWDLERAVGGRWYAVVGALVLIVGVGLGFKWAYDVGLLRVSPLARCLAGVAFGGALIVAGEWLRKKFNAWTGAGATAAGIGSIYVSTFVAYRVFDLLNAPTAFVLLSIVAVLGVALSVRSGLAAVGTISLAGGFITPFLFLDTTPREGVMPLYLLMLLGIGLSIAIAKRGTFAALRITSSIGTLLVGGIWAAGQEAGTAWIAIGYVALAWSMLHAELWIAAKRRTQAVDGEPFAVFAPWRILPVSLGSTTWAVMLCGRLLEARGHPEWWAVLVACVATGAMAYSLSKRPWDPKAHAMDPPRRLAVLLIAESAVLALVTVATALSGRAEMAAWLGLAAAAVWTARRVSSVPIAVYGLIGLAAAIARLLMWELWRSDMHGEPVMVAGLGLTEWSVWMVIAAGVCFFAAVQWPARAFGLFRNVLANGAFVLVAASMGHEASSGTTVAVVLAALAVASMIWMHTKWRFHTSAVAAMLLMTAAMFALYHYSLGPNFESKSDEVLSVGFWVGMWVAAASAATGRLVPRGEKWSRGEHLTFATGALIALFMFTTIEAGRIGRAFSDDSTMQAAGVSIWWGLFSMGLLAWGFWRRTAVGRWMGLALLAVAGFKTVLLDLVDVEALPRVISFIGLGLMMILVPVVYSKLGAKLGPKVEDGEPRQGGEGIEP